MPGLIIILSFVVFIIVMGAMGLRTVKQAEVIIIERLGKYHRTLSPGINIIWPIIDKARPISWRTMSRNRDGSSILIHTMSRSIDLREQVFDFPSQQVITADNVMIEINGLLYYQITDPQAAVYEIANLPNAIEKLAQTTLRNIIGDLALDMTLTSRDEINKKMREVLDEATDKWGVKVNRVEVQDIEPPESVREAMEKQMKAERERRAAILEAEGVKASKVCVQRVSAIRRLLLPKVTARPPSSVPMVKLLHLSVLRVRWPHKAHLRLNIRWPCLIWQRSKSWLRKVEATRPFSCLTRARMCWAAWAQLKSCSVKSAEALVWVNHLRCRVSRLHCDDIG